MRQILGRVWKFGDNVSTDYIQPGFTRGNTPQERAAFCMQSIRPDFTAHVRPGDVIIGGRNFGCGSSRPAAANLLTLGISAVIAESFGRVFFRNSINLGFPVITCRGVHGAFEEGQQIEADLETWRVRNITTGTTLQAEPLPEIALKILSSGGIVALLTQEYGNKSVKQGKVEP